MLSFAHLRTRVTALAAVIVLLLVAGVWVTLTHADAQSKPPSKGGGQAAAASTHGTGSGTGRGSSAKVPSGPLRLVSSTPSAGARRVNGAAAITLNFSAPLASNSPLPRLRPHLAGTWQGAGTSTLTFIPGKGYTQLTHAQVIIPGGATGVRTGDGALLGKTARISFTTGTYQTARLAELLTQLGICR